MNIRTALVVMMSVSVLIGCAAAPQLPVPLATTALSPPSHRIGVAMAALPKVDTQFPGAACLLCLAAASIANSKLTAHTQTLPSEDLTALKKQVADMLRKKGSDSVVIAEDVNVAALPDYSTKGPNVAIKDFSALKSKYSVDKLLIIQISQLGVTRPYASYIPSSDPKAALTGNSYIVNLSNNTYEWYLPLGIAKGSEGPWDEPPKFPGLTNAYFQVIEMAKDSITQPFAN